ncbi:histidine kinase [Bacillus cereus]|uniref:histidine kinase n=1 Tax=Bacillus cereus group TaxID=86661 RepID=UPI000BF2CC51|nr:MULTISPECIES: histidine kinase [Bacillus cereus group]PFA22256.1 histidine kinase [Bacillus cereus]
MDVLQFVQSYIMKSAEKIDRLYVRKEHNVTILPVIKQTPRKVVATAEIFLSEVEVLEASADVTKIFYSPNVKKKESEVLKWLTVHEVTDCIERGILIKEVRFKKDGKTVESTLYRMGYGLFTYMEKNKEIERTKEEEALGRWIQEKKSAPDYTNEYTERLWNLLHAIEGNIENGLPVMDEKRWSFHKVFLFLEFLLAIYKISCEKRAFDWKEVGAAHYRVISGSKKFDPYKKEFLGKLEEVLDAPPHCLGLVSLGTVTPIFFCGDLYEGNTHYECDTVRSLTDLLVFRHEYKTNAKVLWLVENRAVLTRMAAESEFLVSSGSLIVGVDGQLRSGHKKFVQSVLAHSESITKIMIWTDYDSAGKIISDTLFELVAPYECRTRWVSSDGKILSKQEFEESSCLRESEQEESLGGVDIWKEWISQ